MLEVLAQLARDRRAPAQADRRPRAVPAPRRRRDHGRARAQADRGGLRQAARASGGFGGQGTTGGATTSGYSILPMQFVNTPNSGDAHLGSAYDGGWEGYMQKTLQQLRGQHPADPFTSVDHRHVVRWRSGRLPQGDQQGAAARLPDAEERERHRQGGGVDDEQRAGRRPRVDRRRQRDDAAVRRDQLPAARRRRRSR